MDPLAPVQRLLDDALAERVLSGFQLLAIAPSKRFERFGGSTSYWPDAMPVDADTLFDIGSITKTFATTSLLALALEKGRLALEDVVEKYLPATVGSPVGKLRIESLLRHSSGLVGWLPLWKLTNRGELFSWMAKNPKKVLRRGPDEAAEYSDLGFLLLGGIVDAVEGSLADAFRAKVAGPIGCANTSFTPDRKRAIAATEWCLERRRLLVGEVFDENAALLGGACGHAGLFSTANDLAAFGAAWCDAVSGDSSWLDTEVARRFAFAKAGVANSYWHLGWDGRAPQGSTAGTRFSPVSMGALGYPGASLWIDPTRQLVVALLTNRVHPSRVDFRIRALRPALHDALAAWRDGAVS